MMDLGAPSGDAPLSRNNGHHAMINHPTLKEGGKVTVSNLEELAPGPHGQATRPAARLLRVALEQQSD